MQRHRTLVLCMHGFQNRRSFGGHCGCSAFTRFILMLFTFFLSFYGMMLGTFAAGLIVTTRRNAILFGCCSESVWVLWMIGGRSGMSDELVKERKL